MLEYRTVTESLIAEIAHRIERGESLKSIADAAGIAPPVLSRWWSGSRSGITLQTVDRLAAYLNLQLVPRRRSSARPG